VQEGGLSKLTNRYARMVKYDISGPGKARLAREYVVPLPQFNDVSIPLKSPRRSCTPNKVIANKPSLQSSQQRRRTLAPQRSPKSSRSGQTSSSSSVVTAASATARMTRSPTTVKLMFSIFPTRHPSTVALMIHVARP